MKKSKKTPLPSITNFPSPIVSNPPNLSDEQKISYIAQRFKEIMEVMGLDMADPSLTRTPFRVAKMYVQEIFSGLDLKRFPAINFINEEFDEQQLANMVFIKVCFNSFCEHHFVPMNGMAYVAYIPKNKLIGLSKITKIVHYFSARPQLQERLTAQIADSLALLLETEDIAVSLDALHFCIIARGIDSSESSTITNVLRGAFKDDEMRRQEFFAAINR